MSRATGGRTRPKTPSDVDSTFASIIDLTLRPTPPRMPAERSASSSSVARRRVTSPTTSLVSCEACRKGKRRCNRARPTCETCISMGRHCVWVVDGRSLRSSATSTLSLQARIADLEARLHAATGEAPSPSGLVLPALSSRAAASRPDLDTSALSTTSAKWLPGGSLSLSSSGALRYLNPTSSFFRTFHSTAIGAPASPATSDASACDVSPSFLYFPLHLDPTLHQEIIDLALNRTLSYGCFVRADKFLAGLDARPILRTNNFTPFLHLAVLAVGCRYLPSDKWHLVCPSDSAVEDRGEAFAGAAHALLLGRETEDPSLATIRGFLLLSKYKVGMGQDRLAVMYQGLAETIANDFRLNLSYDPKPWDEDLPTDWEAILEDRAQVFATLTCVGSMWGAYVGREAFAYHARLASISIPAIEQIYNRVYPSVDLHIQVCFSFLDALDRWFDALPAGLQLLTDKEFETTEPHVCTLVMFHQAVRIVICRPFIGTVHDHPDIKKVRRTCQEGAWRIVHILRLIRSSPGGSTTGPLTNQDIAFIAGSVFVLLGSGHFPSDSPVDSTPATRASAVRALDDVCAFLTEFGEDVWMNAAQSAKALRTVWEEFTLG